MKNFASAAIAFAAVAFALVAIWPASAGPSGQVIAKYRRSASVRRLGLHVVGRIRGQGTRVVAVAGDPAAAAARIDASPGVAWAEPDYRLRAVDAPNDPLLSQLGGLGLMHATAAWDALGLSASWPA